MNTIIVNECRPLLVELLMFVAPKSPSLLILSRVLLDIGSEHV